MKEPDRLNSRRGSRMHIRKRTVSETETHRLVTVRGLSILAWCRGCGQEVEMVAVERAEELLGVRSASLRQGSGNNRHFAVTSDQKLWICRRWLCHLA
jgi:hypothetical protein